MNVEVLEGWKNIVVAFCEQTFIFIACIEVNGEKPTKNIKKIRAILDIKVNFLRDLIKSFVNIAKIFLFQKSR